MAALAAPRATRAVQIPSATGSQTRARHCRCPGTDRPRPATLPGPAVSDSCPPRSATCPHIAMCTHILFVLLHECPVSDLLHKVQGGGAACGCLRSLHCSFMCNSVAACPPTRPKHVKVGLVCRNREEWVPTAAATTAVAAAKQPQRIHLEHERDQRAGPQLELHAPATAASVPTQHPPPGPASWCVGRTPLQALVSCQCVT